MHCQCGRKTRKLNLGINEGDGEAVISCYLIPHGTWKMQELMKTYWALGSWEDNHTGASRLTISLNINDFDDTN